MRRSLLIRLSLIVLLIALAAASFRIGAQSPVQSVRIIYTNDTNSYLEPCG